MPRLVEEMERHVITGLEPAIVKAATSSAVRVAGWGAGQARERHGRAKVRKLLAGIEASGEGQDSHWTTEEALAKIGLYVQSSQFTHIAHSLATVMVVERSGKKADQAIEAIKAEMIAGAQGGS
jgi:hypothetical protein